MHPHESFINIKLLRQTQKLFTFIRLFKHWQESLINVKLLGQLHWLLMITKLFVQTHV